MYKTDEMIHLSIGTLARLHAHTVDAYCTIDYSKQQIAASLQTLARRAPNRLVTGHGSYRSDQIEPRSNLQAIICKGSLHHGVDSNLPSA
jgi:hypothetical protein